MHKMKVMQDHLPGDWERRGTEIVRNIILGDLEIDYKCFRKTKREKLILKELKNEKS